MLMTAHHTKGDGEPDSHEATQQLNPSDSVPGFWHDDHIARCSGRGGSQRPRFVFATVGGG